MIVTEAEKNLDIFRKYAGVSLPRHVSYPMPTWWHDMDSEAAAAMFDQSNAEATRDLSVYVHVPFCEALCKFCACHRTVMRKDHAKATEIADAYVQAMCQEARQLGDRLCGSRQLRQIHWGGGTPTYLSIDQFAQVQSAILANFPLSEDAEISIEIDPRVTTPEMLTELRTLGFNRISMGVQDFNEDVQRHVRRVQSLSLVRDTVEQCRAAGFDAVNFDLIYGMPYQTPATIRETVEATIDLSPDRIAYYHYAQIPEKIATQRGMDYTKLPDSETKYEMFLIGLDAFTRAGYEFIGLDHFAKPEEGLARAVEDGTLQRNFQGMTTGGGLDMLGIGASSIGHLLGVGFLQNIKATDDYVACLQSGQSPIERGKRFTQEDILRQAVIGDLYCAAQVRPSSIEEAFGIDFGATFARELAVMRELQSDGLVDITSDGRIVVTSPLGRVLMRTVAAVFDGYLAPDAYRVGDQTCFSANA